MRKISLNGAATVLLLTFSVLLTPQAFATPDVSTGVETYGFGRISLPVAVVAGTTIFGRWITPIDEWEAEIRQLTEDEKFVQRWMLLNDGPADSPAEAEANSRVPPPIAAEDTEAAPEGPYDLEVVRAGFDDYNMYLSTDPEYAYRRLDDAFREQYGDSSDVDILIRTIRHTNEGTATLNDAIENAEAFLRLATRISPEEALHPIREHLAELVELRQAAHEEGTELPIYSQTHVFDPTH